MEFRILGPFEAVHDGRPVPLGGPQQRALLVILLLHGREVVSTDRLVDELWGEEAGSRAAHTVQVYVSELRKRLAVAEGERSRIVTRAPGYLLELDEAELDLARFERLLAEARACGEPERAAETLRDALGLWHGPALADFVYEPFAQRAIARLEELRLMAVEERVDADLACGRHGELVGELEALVAEHALRERLRGHLMLALYRAGRQAEALDVYQQGRRVLVEELGIDPSPALQRLEQAILRQDSELELDARRVDVPQAARARPERAILVSAETDEELDRLLALAETLARREPAHELILVRVLPAAGEGGRELGRVVASLNGHRERLFSLGGTARTAAFSAPDPTAEVARLAQAQDVDLLLLAVPEDALEAPGLGEGAAGILEAAPCDVAALVVGARIAVAGAAPVLVPFGGAEHDWAALELGAWLSLARDAPLRLLGRDSAHDGTGRDASRLIAYAGLAVQQLVGVATEPVLAPAGPEGVVEAAAEAGLVVLGLPDEWRQDGAGAARAAIAVRAPVPVVLVRRGPRPGGMTPTESLTRFTWSLGSGGPSA